MHKYSQNTYAWFYTDCLNNIPNVFLLHSDRHAGVVDSFIDLCWRWATCLKTSAPCLSAGWQWTNEIPPCESWVESNSSLSTFTGHAQNGGTRWPSSWHTDEVVLGKLEHSTLQPPWLRQICSKDWRLVQNQVQGEHICVDVFLLSAKENGFCCRVSDLAVRPLRS